jgi:hypothetical protein
MSVVQNREEMNLLLPTKRNWAETDSDMSVLTVRPFVGDGGDGVVSSSVLQRVLRRRVITGWRCER